MYMARPICIDGRMPPERPRPTVTITSPHAPGMTPCDRCGKGKPITRIGDCFTCESWDRSERTRIARERAIAAYGEGRC